MAGWRGEGWRRNERESGKQNKGKKKGENNTVREDGERKEQCIRRKKERSDVIGALSKLTLSADRDQFTKGLCSVKRRRSRVGGQHCV